MANATLQRGQIAKCLITYIILFSSAITLITTAMQLYGEYTHDINDIGSRIGLIKKSYAHGISSALWVEDKEQLLAILDGIRELPDIEYAEISVKNIIYLSSGFASEENDVKVTFPLQHQHRSKIILIGEMRIEASFTGTYLRLKKRIVTILLANGTKTFLVAIFLYFIFNYLVTRHLVKISDFALAHNINDLDHRINLDRKRKHRIKDEIDVVAESLNKMQENLAVSITKLKNSEERLFKEKERAQVTLHSIADAVITTNAEGFVQYMNPVAEELIGLSCSEACDRPLTEVFHIINELTHQPEEDPIKKCLRQGSPVALGNHTALIREDGQQISVEDSAAPIRDQAGQIIGAVMVFHDVSNERKLRHQLSFQASHDSLTGLVNRRELEHRLAEALASANNPGWSHALIYLDLDQFKVVNDTCGHLAGDEMLRQLSVVLKEQIRAGDTLGRLGGDEFGILLENCTLVDAQRIAENFCQTVKDFRFVWQDRPFDISASIGVSGITANSKSVGSILSTADVACYAAKEQGRNRIHVYTDEDMELAQRQGEMHYVAQIKKALQENQFCLYGQRIVPVDDQDEVTAHCEVLIRMIDEQGKIIPPGTFLPAAERYNLMPDIDRWVINQAFTLYPTLGYSGTPCKLSINLSAASLNDDNFLADIRALFQKHKTPPENITFEITETTAIANLTKAVDIIKAFKAIGCHFSLDDFGSGVSSFAYLKNLPVDYLKIDGVFVKDMVDDLTDWTMVEAIVKIGHVMGLKIIAEFVETGAILAELKKIGVDYAQGYEICMPKPLAEVFDPPDSTGSPS